MVASILIKILICGINKLACFMSQTPPMSDLLRGVRYFIYTRINKVGRV